METFYIIDKEGKIVAEIKHYEKPAVPVYFMHALAHTFDVPVDRVLTQQAYDKKYDIYRCSCCQINPVNVHDGYDTCPDCIGKI